MALPLPSGLMPSEAAFLCEMELVTVVPRQRLESIELLSGPTPKLRPPHKADLPFWLALLLKKQRRANIVPPAWLHPDSLREIVTYETAVDVKDWAPPPPPPVRADGRGNSRKVNLSHGDGGDDVVLSPPFLPSCTSTAPAGALPYHWFEFAEMLLAHASDDVPSASDVRSLLRDLQEARAAKMRSKITQPESHGQGVTSLRGVGAMELAESRGFVTGVAEGIRKIGASAETMRREEEEENGQDVDDESDDDMGL
ncbi:DNA replication complex GINS protein PSF2 [Trichoderma cornu-damae]|uniref:DNA replication complex GINS protein PSF2 n=1 Tax=Trichoderma cornu-damae TaxID=654480 RepID=A0A9P8TXH8_9HYPO|nr:DNA replication complex GINS protein PSF2 [Trichoderma cornu-damae]